MSKLMTWDQVILIPLRDGKPAQLKSIYRGIGDQLRDGYINPDLFNPNLRYGDRPRYTHAVRAVMKSLEKRGMVRHIGTGKTGIYQITDKGKELLEVIKP